MGEFKRALPCTDPNRILDIGTGRTEAKNALKKLGFDHFHVFDRIRFLCRDFVSDNHNDKDLDIAKYQDFVDELNSKGRPDIQYIKDIAKLILDREWDLCEFRRYLDKDKYWIEDYAEYIRDYL